MRISTKFGGMMLVIILLTGFLMFFTLTSINEIDITTEHRKGTRLDCNCVIPSKRRIQITVAYDISANRGEPVTTMLEMAAMYYESAKDRIELLRIGTDEEVINTISKNWTDHNIGRGMAKHI